MKIFNSTLVLIALCLSFELIAQENCTYEYDPAQTSLEWTAFKFAEKTGVKGKFDSIKVIGKQKDKTKLGAVKSLQFQIDVSSVNSGVPDRDGKIKKFFFRSVKGNGKISGNFSDIASGDTGTAKLNLRYGNSKTSIPVNFVWKDEIVEVTGTVDVVSLGLQTGLNQLNAECNDLHKGSDGVSKLWPTVDVKVVSTLKKVCK
ncbi:YceI family protein [Leptospira sp. 2 VSF19]|uniref:YceI family protein n=1 Tax=Leptospira soteropolitanensis TaxID=2950025 RepID=A0AAW5VL38_9LEPT|nr:YceI family protein [Leptospira soteropolitanensis]MCW7491754.1 YceI family protein [Leptospira soteropolitanensis]MCW7499339.1 YceI family protein [Leptospira soteropolitanensis]MCW7521070.1 YceI family protein [Leptospira soteropolitanensis]MCW7525442.1 YceI family protein [Leptospira soteropolitanensis]MCW7529309.1 YceI family protein [Leptospira soteropolitanensis]